jgi:hypothetical protein
MKRCPQASTPSAVGSQGTILASPAALTAFCAMVSAASRYCSASTGDTLSASALLSKPSRFSSVGKLSAAPLLSPSRSRTVLLYSVRVTLRI